MNWWQFLICIGIGVFSLPFAVFLRLIPDKWFYCFFKNQEKIAPKEIDDEEIEASNTSLNSSLDKTTLRVFRTVRGGRLLSLSSITSLNGSQKISYSNGSLNKSRRESIRKSQSIAIDIPKNDNSRQANIDDEEKN